MPVTHEASDLDQRVAIDGESLFCQVLCNLHPAYKTMLTPAGCLKEVKGSLDVICTIIWVVFWL